MVASGAVPRMRDTALYFTFQQNSKL